jgi:hypothetical protein
MHHHALQQSTSKHVHVLNIAPPPAITDTQGG